MILNERLAFHSGVLKIQRSGELTYSAVWLSQRCRQNKVCHSGADRIKSAVLVVMNNLPMDVSIRLFSVVPSISESVGTLQLGNPYNNNNKEDF